MLRISAFSLKTNNAFRRMTTKSVDRHLLQEAQKIAFDGPLSDVWYTIKLINRPTRGAYHGYHGTSLNHVFDQALKGEFEPGRRIYVADPSWGLHIALDYARMAVDSPYGPANHAYFDPKGDVFHPDNAKLCEVVLGISSDTKPLFNSRADDDRDSRFEYFPPAAKVYIDALTLLHPKIRFAGNFNDNNGDRRIRAFMWGCPEPIQQKMQDHPQKNEIISMIQRLDVYPKR